MTIFDRIIRRELPADVVYETEEVLAFRDIHPVAPVHVLVIPKVAVEGLAHAGPEHEALLGKLMIACGEVARILGIDRTGYRVVTNVGSDGGQSVFHLHLHVLGGRPLGWPPG